MPVEMNRTFLFIAAFLPFAETAVAHPAFLPDSLVVTQPDTTASDRTVYLRVDEPPRFQGGDVLAFRDWVLRHLHLDGEMFREGVQARLVVSFVVGKDGGVEDVEVIRSTDERFSGEVLRVMSAAPLWTPGRLDGKAVRTKLSVPVNIRLEIPTAADSLAAGLREHVPQEGGQALTVADRMPQFQGGDLKRFRSWVIENLKYPEEALKAGLEEQILVSFVIEKDGSLSNIVVQKGLNSIIVREVVKVLSASPLWEPGWQNGKPVRVRYSMPFNFMMDKTPHAEVPSQNPNPAARGTLPWGGSGRDAAWR